MIKFIKDGDIFTSGCQVLVNPVNCVGVMGAGLAAAFKAKFPGNFSAYKAACDEGDLRPGYMHVYHEYMKGVYIVNFPTKNHWKDKSKLGDICVGLENLGRLIVACDFKSIALPALGCGLGGLAWVVVKPCIELELGELGGADGMGVVVYEPR